MRISARFGWVWAASAALSATAPAWADKFLDEANALFKSIQADRRSDTALFPLLAKLTEPPAPVRRAADAALLAAGRPGFSDAAAWAQADPQKAALAGLAKVTSERDWKKSFAIGQPYGFEGVDPDLVTAGVYTELGDPPTLLGAQFNYLRFLDRLESLAHVEATRLAAAGDAKAALDVLFNLAVLGRQVADRSFLTEKQWGLRCTLLALQRLRDVTYVDGLRDTPSLNADHLRDVIARLKDRAGIFGTERLELPRGQKIGAEQMLARVFGPDGTPRADAFATVLGRARSAERPLRLFSETARWSVQARTHAGEPDVRRALDALFADWRRRWELPPFDPSLGLPSEYAKLDKVRFAALEQLVGNLGELFDVRRQLIAEIRGTRTALGVAGFRRLNKDFPPALTAIRPALVDQIEGDPFERSGKPPVYFVPGKRPNDTGTTHEIAVFPGEGQPNFSVVVSNDTFVLFFTGPDGAPNGARRATQTVEDPRGDYLIWPPVLSLLREHLNASAGASETAAKP